MKIYEAILFVKNSLNIVQPLLAITIKSCDTEEDFFYFHGSPIDLMNEHFKILNLDAEDAYYDKNSGILTIYYLPENMKE